MFLFQSTLAKLLKWAGVVKRKFIEDIKQMFPKIFLKEEFTFVEPFVGSGAVLWILNNFPNAKNVVINDINKDLIGIYNTIKNNSLELVNILEKFQNDFHSLNKEEQKREYYNQKRENFNSKQENKSTNRRYLYF